MRRPSGIFLLAFVIFLYLTGSLGTFSLAVVFAVVVAAAFRWLPRRFCVHPVAPNNFVLITGASRGLGKQVALYLASRGISVFAGVRRQADGDALLSAAAGKSKDFIKPVIIDVSLDDSVAKGVEDIKSHLEKCGGKLVGFVQNAGLLTSGALELKPVNVIKTQFDTNVFGSIRVLQHVLPLLRQSPGKSRVILVGSTAAYSDSLYGGGYRSSKMALEGICEELRNQIAQFGIGVTFLAPGIYTTDLVDNINADPIKYAEQALQQRGDSNKIEDFKAIADRYTKDADAMNTWFALGSAQPVRWVAEEVEYILRAWSFWVPTQRCVGFDADIAAVPFHWWVPDAGLDLLTRVLCASPLTPLLHTAFGLPAKKWAEMFPQSPVPE